MNKTKTELVNNKIRNRSILIYILLISMIAIEIYFLYSFLTKGLLVHYGYSIQKLSSIIYPIILILLLVITTISLSLIIYGFINKKSWTIKFSVMYIIWAMLWLIWGLLVGSQIIENIILICLYGLIMITLVSSYIREYFTITDAEIKQKNSSVDKGIISRDKYRKPLDNKNLFPLKKWM